MAFLSFEGIEGCGKSTQVRLLAEALGPRALVTQEPGGTELGQRIRELLLERGRRIAPAAEVLLFFADRAQHVAETIRPALAEGRVVISDRYADSSLAYQGHARGLPLETLRAVLSLATGGLQPDLTFFIDLPVEVALARVARRGAHDRLESERVEFHEKVRDGYRVLAREAPTRFVTLDGLRPVEEIAAEILARARPRIAELDGVR